LLPEVIRIVAKKLNKENVEQIIPLVKEETIEFLNTHIAQQALLFTQHRCQNSIFQLINKNVNSIEEYTLNLSLILVVSNADEIYRQTLEELHQIIDSKDFLMALKIINHKGLLPSTSLTSSFGWKNDYYIDYVLSLLSINDEFGNELRKAFKEYIVIE